MLRKRLAALVALVALGVAACSGGGVATSPVASSTPAGTSITSSGAAVAAAGVSGITGSVTVAGSGAVTASESATQPAGLPVLSSIARANAQSLKSAQATSNTPLVYVSLLASAASTITGIPAASFTFAMAPTGSTYLAFYNGSVWATIAGPGTVSGSTVTFGATTFATPITIAAGASLFLAVYQGGVLVPATPTPNPSPSASASSSATNTPSPTPTQTPTQTPSSTPTTTSSPTVVNGNFATGTLAGWSACSYAYTWTGYNNASPTPITTASPATKTYAAQTNPSALVSVVTPPPNLNPIYTTGAAPMVLGSYVALTGAVSGETPGVVGLCQTVTVTSAAPYLSFYVWEGGAETSTKYATQEADILNSAGTAVVSNLFTELNCFADPGVVGMEALTSNCVPTGLGGTGTYSGSDAKGGYWVQRGPFNLTSQIGQTVTLFIGIWDQSTDSSAYGNEMFVGNVQFSNSSSFPTGFTPMAIFRR